MKQLRLPSIQSEVWIVIAFVVLFFGLAGITAWFGPDPSQVIRASAPEVPNYSNLSEEEIIAKLKETVQDKRSKYPVFIVKLSNDDSLRLDQGSTGSSFQWTRIVPIAQLDTFLYAQQAAKGDRYWNIHLYCANYQKCITGSNSRIESNFTLNAAAVLHMPPNGNVRQVLGLLKQLLALHGAQSTIDTSKNTIRISEEYSRKADEN